jgi:hypothetical protein
VGKFLSNQLNAGILFCESLEPIVAQRFRERELRRQGHNIPEQVKKIHDPFVVGHLLIPSLQKDCVQWIMQYSPQSEEKAWSVSRVVHELIAVWFGSVHITSTVRIGPPICARPWLICP